MTKTEILDMMIQQHSDAEGKIFLVSNDIMTDLKNNTMISIDKEGELSYKGHKIITHKLLKSDTAFLMSERDLHSTIEEFTKLLLR